MKFQTKTTFNLTSKIHKFQITWLLSLVIQLIIKKTENASALLLHLYNLHCSYIRVIYTEINILL